MLTSNIFDDIFSEETQDRVEDSVIKILSISEYNSLINDLLSETLLKVSGEVTELNNWQEKYTYITLKDCDVDTVTTSVFGITPKLAPEIYKIKIGDIVVIEGRPGIHTKTGRHSLQAEKIFKLEEGYYEKKREELIKKLTDEGLIDVSKKRKIVRVTNKIALITAIPSQAYNDFTKIFNSRWGQGTIDVYKAQMQGATAYKTVVEVLQKINSGNTKYDCVVVARGGGSKEDLINFDSEELVRMLFACKYPTISAVGHEGDISICDLVADLRASTPSNAAELISTPDKNFYLNESLNVLENIYERIKNKIELKLELIDRSLENIKSDILNNVEILDKNIDSKIKLLDAYDISNTLKRGFSMITNEQDHPITEHNNIEKEKIYNVYLKDGKKQRYKFTKSN